MNKDLTTNLARGRIILESTLIKGIKMHQGLLSNIHDLINDADKAILSLLDVNISLTKEQANAISTYLTHRPVYFDPPYDNPVEDKLYEVLTNTYPAS